MRKLLAVLVVLCCWGTAFAAKFPEMGICTGERVRLRQSPGTKGKFLGFVEPDRNRFVILGETRADGMKWYKIDHPTKKGTAYIAADYVEITPVGNIFAEVRLTFGVYPEKTRAIFGPSVGKGSEHLGIYERYNFWYNADGIWTASVMRPDGKAIAGIHIGDKPEKLLALGMPASNLDIEEDEEYGGFSGNWTMKNADTGERIYFQFSGSTREEVAIDCVDWDRPTGDD